MHFNTSVFFFLTFVLLYSGTIAAQYRFTIDWERAAVLPGEADNMPHPGLAGPFTGHSNGAILIAGGANFPHGLPWEGGKKMYHDRIYVLLEGNDKKYHWVPKIFHLPNAVAYGASVLSDESIICIGGENQAGISATVIRLRWDPDKKQLKTEELPSLPIALTNLSAAIAGNRIFVAGGETAIGTSDKLFCLDLGNIHRGWAALDPLPGPVANAVFVPQMMNGTVHLFLIGGRTKHSGALTDFHAAVYAYNLTLNKWHVQASMPYKSAAGLAFAYTGNTICYMGGDNGDVYRSVEKKMGDIASATDEQKRKMLQEEKNQLQITHPGFSKKILVFNTEINHWDSLGELPFPTPVTTGLFVVGHTVFIPSGEVKPGIRTPDIWIGHLNDK